MLITELGYGGAERAFLGLAGELAKRHQVEIALFKRHYASGNYARAEQDVGLPVHLLDKENAGRIARWRGRVSRLRSLKDKVRPDVTISFLTGPNLLNVLTRRCDRVAVSVRGTRWFDQSRSAHSRFLHRWSIDFLTMRLADLVVSVSESLTREISGARGVAPPAKFRTISGYVDSTRLIATATAAVEANVQALAVLPLIVAAGRMAPEKGFQNLISTFAAIKPAMPEAKLLLIGDGPAAGDLKKKARGLGLAVCNGEAADLSPFDVIFLGFRPDPHRYYRLGRVFVLSSITEGFPNTLAEALASGSPILAVDAPWGAREVLGLPADPMNRPFGTIQPTETGLGTLMPRMDRPEFARMWKHVLLDRLRHDRRSAELTDRQRERLRELDAAHAASLWEQVLEQKMAEGDEIFHFPLVKRVVNRLGRPFGLNPFPRAFANPTTQKVSGRSNVFDIIYQTNFWGSGESHSGVGSERGSSMAYLARLRSLIEERGFRRLFDAPCGDLNWIVELARDPTIAYAGGDISSRLIADLRQRFPDVDLRVFDICQDPFPNADVWHCRDCLFHLPFSDIQQALTNFVRSNIPYALLTTHRARWLHKNLDVPLGGFRFLDLERRPIGLGKPDTYLADYAKGSDFPRFLGLWKREAVADQVHRWKAR